MSVKNPLRNFGEAKANKSNKIQSLDTTNISLK